jgi:hypothetical protein
MGLEPWLLHVMGEVLPATAPALREADEFVRRCRARGLDSERLYGIKTLEIHD